MPTFYDPVADAEEASQALRGLAHASRDFTHPEDAYGVIGDLLAGVRSMQQSIQQLATRQHHPPRVTVDGSGAVVDQPQPRGGGQPVVAVAQMRQRDQPAGRNCCGNMGDGPCV